ncbi:hypothetical protein Tco_1539874 [Tanacetum coccineum]
MISACGIDSVPVEIGFLFNTMQCVYPAVVNQVEAYMNLESDIKVVANYGTYESAVLGLANVDKLKELRRSKQTTARPSIVGPAPAKGLKIDTKEDRTMGSQTALSRYFHSTTNTCKLAANSNGLHGMNEHPNS